jgi:hypothetical protein
MITPLGILSIMARTSSSTFDNSCGNLNNLFSFPHAKRALCFNFKEKAHGTY